MKKTILLRTADGLHKVIQVEKDTRVVERLITRRHIFRPDEKIKPFQPASIRRYQFEGSFHYDGTPPKAVEIFDEVL